MDEIESEMGVAIDSLSRAGSALITIRAYDVASEVLKIAASLKERPFPAFTMAPPAATTTAPAHPIQRAKVKTKRKPRYPHLNIALRAIAAGEFAVFPLPPGDAIRRVCERLRNLCNQVTLENNARFLIDRTADETGVIVTRVS